MRPTIVILSCPQDVHAHAMCEALERKGAHALFFPTPDFPERVALTIKDSPRGTVLMSRGPSGPTSFSDCTAVWLRRPHFARVPEDFGEEDRKIIERECRDMRLNFFDLLCPASLWVNPLGALFAESCKSRQLVAARQCGFKIPPTLISNDSEEIAHFLQAAKGSVVYKTFSSLVPTSVLTPDLLSDPELLRWTPGIYQHYIEKDHELRVTAVGHRLFVVRINSQQTIRGKVDWREAQWQPRNGASDLTFEPAALPAPVKAACRRILKALNLAYGAIDLIVTPEQEYVFLEVNPSGQFLWIDFELGLPLLDALSEMLIQGRLDFRWSPRAPRIRFDSEFLQVVEERQRQCMSDHVSELMPW